MLVGVLAVGVLLAAILAGCSGSATGGGWMSSKGEDGKATFGFRVAYDGCDWKGNVSYTDHGYAWGDCKTINLHGKVTGGTSSRVTGTYQPKPKGEPGTFTVWLKDEGQPQKGEDTFRIKLSGGSFDGYEHSGELGGGNAVIPD